MDLSSLDGYSDAVKVFSANVSPRYLALENLEKWANGKQYAGLPDWFSIEKPLWERAPCITYLLTKESIESKVDLVLGEGRFPQITTSPGEGDPLAEAQGDNASDQSGLDKKSSALLDAFIGRVLSQSGAHTALREALHHGQEVSSGVLIFGVRKGKLFCDTTKAHWCNPVLDVDGECASLEIKYPYLDSYKDEWGKWKVRVRLFRRVIDAESDTTFKPADADQHGKEPDWAPDPKQVFKHGFGFCPVRWYPFLRGSSAVNQIDGKAPHELLLDEIRALDFALSQRHRAALTVGDPQWTECGVTPGFNPSAAARTAEMPGTANGGPIIPGVNPQTTSWAKPESSQPARMKSPGVVWQYPDKDTKVTLHALPGDAVKVISDHAADLRMKLCEMLAYVPLDPDAISHLRQLSAKAIEALSKRERNRCDRIRDDFGDNCLVPTVQMLLRICAAYADGKRADKLNLAGLPKVAEILKRYLENDVSLRLVWGDYDNPDPQEEQLIVTTTVAAHEAGLITDRQAVAKLQDIYDIENVDEAVKALQAEKAQRQADAMATAAAMKPTESKDGESPPKPGVDAKTKNGKAPAPQPQTEA